MYKCISMHVCLLDAKVYISYGAGFSPLPPSCLTASAFSAMPASLCLCKKGLLPEASLLVLPQPSWDILDSEMYLSYMVFFLIPSACSLWLDPNLSKHRSHDPTFSRVHTTLVHSFREMGHWLYEHTSTGNCGVSLCRSLLCISLCVLDYLRLMQSQSPRPSYEDILRKKSHHGNRTTVSENGLLPISNWQF